MWGALGETVTHRTTCVGDKQYANFNNSLFSFLQLKIIAHSINVELVGVKYVVYNEIFFDKYIRKDYISSGAPSGRSRRLPTIMRPKLSKQSALKLAGRINDIRRK